MFNTSAISEFRRLNSTKCGCYGRTLVLLHVTSDQSAVSDGGIRIYVQMHVPLCLGHALESLKSLPIWNKNLRAHASVSKF